MGEGIPWLRGLSTVGAGVIYLELAVVDAEEFADEA
jgi:hypothetical protein